MQQLLRDVLGERYVEVEVSSYRLDEDLLHRRATLRCELALRPGVTRLIHGTGVGLVDALFEGLKQALADEYPNLHHVHFVDFELSGDFSSRGAGDESGSGAPGVVKLALKNSLGRPFAFSTSSSSVTAGSIEAVVRSVEHFINAERAAGTIERWVAEAPHRSHDNFVEADFRELGELVLASAYCERLERVREASTAG